MAVSSVFYLDKITLSSAATTISAISNSRIDAGIQTMVERGAGEVTPNFIASPGQRPQISFTTTQLDTIFGAVPVTGASLTDAVMYLKQGSTTGRVARATTTHKKVACTTAHIQWTTIRMNQSGAATADVVITPVWDETNDPLILTGSIALSGTIATQNYFKAGLCKINGTAVGAIQEITINSGVTLEQIGADGDLFDTFVGTKTIAPTVEVRTVNMVNWSSVTGTMYGVALDGSAGFLAYGRAYSSDGTMVANATTSHVSFQALTGRVIPLSTSGSGSEVVSDHFRVEIRGTPTLSTGVAIS